MVRAEPPDLSSQPPRRIDPVTVTATRAERDILEVPGNVSVIDREVIEASGLEYVAEILRREPGLYVTNTSTSPDGFSVEARGFNDGGGDGSEGAAGRLQGPLTLGGSHRVSAEDHREADPHAHGGATGAGEAARRWFRDPGEPHREPSATGRCLCGSSKPGSRNCHLHM